MDIQALKNQFIKEFLKLKDELIILKLSQVLSAEQQNEKQYQLSPEEMDAVEEGLQDFEIGNTYSHEEVMSEMKTKYPHLFK